MRRTIPPPAAGQTFGRLTVLGPADPGPRGHAQSQCRCSCGNVVVVANSRLLSGHTRSCGCLVFENKNNLIHGESYTRLHSVWAGMKQRCLNPRSPAFPQYGGRGVSVCKEWLSYTTFAAWAKSNGYRDDLTLERVDVNGGYTPANCRFIPLAEQARNRRSSHLLTYKGQTKCLEAWAKEFGINSGTLGSRLRRYGWSLKYALEDPVGIAGLHGKQRPYKIYAIYPLIDELFGGCGTYEELAEQLAAFIDAHLIVRVKGPKETTDEHDRP